MWPIYQILHVRPWCEARCLTRMANRTHRYTNLFAAKKQYMNRNFNGTLQSDGLHVEDCCRQNWMNDVMLVFVRSFIEFYSKYSPHSGAHGTTHTTVRRFTQTISVICVNMCAVECSCYDPHISVAMVRLHVTCLPVSFVCVVAYWTTSTSSIVVVVERAQTICALNEMVSWMK